MHGSEINDALKKREDKDKVAGGLQDRLATQIKHQEELIKSLAMTTKLAAGVWPPPEAAMNMARSGISWRRPPPPTPRRKRTH